MIQKPNNPYPFIYSKPVKETIFLKNFISNPNITVGDYTYYHDYDHPERFESQNVRNCYTVKLIIGRFCAIAVGTTFIMSNSNHAMDGFSTYPFFIFEEPLDLEKHVKSLPQKGDTVVGNDVWFGTNSVIMPGITIGDGAIIGAYAVVTKDVAPYEIVAGNPARLIRKRFSEDVIDELQAIAWWNWNHDKIAKNISAITGNDLQKLKKC
jgi:virginiamycin A acetyltransferase